MKEEFKSVLRLGFTQEDFDVFEYIGTGFKIIIIDENNKQICTSSISGSELAKKGIETPEEYVSNEVNKMKKQCPEDLGNGMVITDYKANGRIFSLIVKCSGENLEYAKAINNNPINVLIVKNNILKTFNLKSLKVFAEKGLGYMYEFYENDTKISSLEITTLDIKNYIQNNSVK